MKTITDEITIDRVYAEYSTFFSSRPPFLLLNEYEKGEFLNAPHLPLSSFLIVASGSVSIYDITDDGRIRYITRTGKGTVLGDVEFSGALKRTFYSEAVEKTVCLSVPFRENMHVLENDPVFLCYVISGLGKKLSYNSVMDLTSSSLEEKLLVYLREISPLHEITSVNEAVQILHSSRRQLQRVLLSLSSRGVIRKTGRGCYRLASLPE